MKLISRLVKDKSQFYQCFANTNTPPYDCQIWQTSESGRVIYNTKAFVEGKNDKIRLVDPPIKEINQSQPVFFYFNQVGFAFKSILEGSDVKIPNLMCAPERRKKDRISLISGISITVKVKTQVFIGEVLDISEKGISLKITTPLIKINDKVELTELKGMKKDEQIEGVICHVTRHAELSEKGTEPLISCHIGIQIEKGWGFDIESIFSELSEKEERKMQIYKISMLTEAEKESLNNTVEDMFDHLKNTKFNILLKNFMGLKKTSYLRWHSDMSAILSISVAKKLDWVSEGTLKKFITVCCLHDLVFTECPRVSEIKDKVELELMKNMLSPKEIFLFENHPHLSSSIAKELANMSSDIEKILFQQRELPDGSGWPLGINHSKITSLSCLFIICHDLADYLYHSKDLDMRSYCLELRDKYKGQSFYKVINAALELFKA